MSDDEPSMPRWSIEPEPTAAELVAILTVLRSGAEIEPPGNESTESSWARAARREQLRVPLDETGIGWNR
jgi:hypothetical protein